MRDGRGPIADRTECLRPRVAKSGGIGSTSRTTIRQLDSECGSKSVPRRYGLELTNRFERRLKLRRFISARQTFALTESSDGVTNTPQREPPTYDGIVHGESRGSVCLEWLPPCWTVG